MSCPVAYVDGDPVTSSWIELKPLLFEESTKYAINLTPVPGPFPGLPHPSNSIAMDGNRDHTPVPSGGMSNGDSTPGEFVGTET